VEVAQPARIASATHPHFLMLTFMDRYLASHTPAARNKNLVTEIVRHAACSVDEDEMHSFGYSTWEFTFVDRGASALARELPPPN
jgi:hypothetical protein